MLLSQNLELIRFLLRLNDYCNYFSLFVNLLSLSSYEHVVILFPKLFLYVSSHFLLHLSILLFLYQWQKALSQLLQIVPLSVLLFLVILLFLGSSVNQIFLVLDRMYTSFFVHLFRVVVQILL